MARNILEVEDVCMSIKYRFVIGRIDFIVVKSEGENSTNF